MKSSTGIRRRTALVSLAGAFAAAACGGGGSSAPPPPPPPPTGASRLRLSGSTMLGPDGQPVMLRGINEGTWGQMRSYDAATIRANGANVVRLLIRWWGLYGNADVESRLDGAPGHFDPAHVQQLLQEIRWSTAAGLWVVVAIDSNCGQYGLQNPQMAQYCDPAGAFPSGHNFWTDLSQRALFQQAWVYLAGLLKDEPGIAMYELLPEPLQDSDPSMAGEVSAFYQQLMAAIEDQVGDRATPFLVGARNAYDIKLCDEAYIADPRWTDRVVYTGDLFIHPNQPTQEQNLALIDSRLGALAAMKASRNVPVFVQQYGIRTGDDPGDFYLDAGLAKLTAAGIGYAGWQWRQNTPNADDYAVVLTDPATGQDIVKQDVLDVYSRWWRA